MGNIEEARSIIEDILSRSEFQPRSKAEIPFKEIREFFKKILEGIVNFITDILEAIFGNLDGRGNSGPSFVGNPVTLTILKAVLLVAIITVIVFICIKIIKVKNWNKKMKIVSEEEIENFIKDTDLAYSIFIHIFTGAA